MLPFLYAEKIMKIFDILKPSYKFVIDPMYEYYYDENDNRLPMKFVKIKVNQFDNLWKNEPNFYIQKGGKGEIKGRYDRFEQWLKSTTEPIKAPSIYISDNKVGFNNGRHRFAWLRDHGYSTIPVTMTLDDYKKAKKLNILA